MSNLFPIPCLHDTIQKESYTITVPRVLNGETVSCTAQPSLFRTTRILSDRDRVLFSYPILSNPSHHTHTLPIPYPTPFSYILSKPTQTQLVHHHQHHHPENSHILHRKTYRSTRSILVTPPPLSPTLVFLYHTTYHHHDGCLFCRGDKHTTYC